MACCTNRILGRIAGILLAAAIVTAEAHCDDTTAVDSKQATDTAAEKNAAKNATSAEQPAWKELELRPDGKWTASRFGGDGEIEFKDGTVSFGFGDPLTGIYWEGDYPKIDYEISLEARRTGGFDFFCGLTVPVEDRHCSVILGGWGGSLIGISSIDGRDASENETMQFLQFEQEKWYQVRFRVSRSHLRLWLDDREMIEFERDERPLGIRPELEFSLPLGIAAYQCQAEIRKVRVRLLTEAEKRPATEAEEKAAAETAKAATGQQEPKP